MTTIISMLHALFEQLAIRELPLMEWRLVWASTCTSESLADGRTAEWTGQRRIIQDELHPDQIAREDAGLPSENSIMCSAYTQLAVSDTYSAESRSRHVLHLLFCAVCTVLYSTPYWQ
ncbi:hypothetical protein VFPPC_16442 [Pochonia chlamydosporia 170]|uniref:Uncharacterized protein n=1 Tax=Pochonia chlamydosporia 170 TaxID=1380566 RepID=A0A179FCL3_METCM|nr:hypothetical protein VFPPC_16442 [Pochonia chlamydosporia 170]OAQ63226.1 hypothetical protein VFPPC_16442 [Pochonia chlamydosporia 170]